MNNKILFGTVRFISVEGKERKKKKTKLCMYIWGTEIKKSSDAEGIGCVVLILEWSKMISGNCIGCDRTDSILELIEQAL